MEVGHDDDVVEVDNNDDVMEVDNDDNAMEVSVPLNPFDDVNDDIDNDLLFEPIRLSRCMSSDIHKRMVTHVIWPRKLPSKVTGDSSEHETALVALMADTLEWMRKTNDWLASSSKLFLGLYNTNTSPDAQIIASEINRLEDGDMFGYFVKGQNCGISIYVPPRGDASIDPKSAIVSTFPVSISNEEIYSTSHSEFQVELPNQSVQVAFSALLNSKDFSEQLEYLNNNPLNGKDNGNNTYVSQWLVPMLSMHRDSVLRQNDLAIISKKIRDDVIGWKLKQLMEPFRRCAHWTFMKAILQFNLTVQWGEVNGKIMYKLVMLKVMAMLCNYYDGKLYHRLDVDVVLHMLAKLARRIEKINNLLSLLDDEYSDLFETFPNGFEDTYNTIIDEVKNVISKVKSKLDQQTAQVQQDHEEKSTLIPLGGLDFDADVQQKVPNLRQHLADRNAPTEASANNGQLTVKSYIRHSFDSLAAPDVTLFDAVKDPVDVGIFLCDFENWILYGDVNIRPKRLRSLALAYARLAAQHYKNNPLGFSRTILTQTKILASLDKIAAEAHDMLTKHRAGINPDIFDNLILPQYEDCEIAHNLKKYFLNRSKAKLLPSLIEEQKMTANSFSVRYARDNDDMQKVIDRIHRSTDAAMALLEQEYEMGRKEVAEMRKNLEKTECSYVVNSNRKREHRSSCARCKLEAKISAVRVSTMEDPLPENEDEQNAVAFELHIPIKIACLRDVLYVVVNLLNEPAKNIRIFEKWSSLDVLKEFNVHAEQSVCVFLGTSVRGRHGRTRSSGMHPDNTFESCKLPNNRNCILYAHNDSGQFHIPTNIDKQSANKSATLLVEKGSPYESLQWTVSGTVHTQNQVIARQSECPQSLRLCEFKNFGSLRADGHRLQLRKLYSMIETESLSFETLSVQALIMQTLWEKGPSNPLAVQWNESHADFTDPKFAGAMIELIDKFLNTQKSNWKHPLKLLMTVVIAVRVFEMNDDDDVADRIVQLLVKLRDIAYDWIAKVQTAMHDTPGGAQDDVQKLRMNLLEIAIAGALTFGVHFRHRHFDKIFIGSAMNSITAVRFWLEFLVTINDNILMSDKGSKKRNKIESSQLTQQMLQQWVRHIAVQVQSKVKKVIVSDPTDVFDFIRPQWNPSRDGIFRLELDANHPETLIISTTIDNVENFVQIGILTGEFLVNNLPVSRLPKTITEHSVYQRVFDKFIFEVQELNGRFDTKYKYNDRHYSFCANDDGVIVTERKLNGDECELIPENIFAEEIPYLLVQNHSHWWCRTTNLIEFRPICFSDANFSLPQGIQYELDLNDGRLRHKKTKRVMLDVTSETYRKIVSQLSRLESNKYIQIFMEKPRIAKIELVRMNIKFIVDACTHQQSYDIISNEFNGMTVCLQQNCGTLYGLRKGLLLVSASDGKGEQNKLLILPHGNVSAKITGCHETVDIDAESTLRNPPFFIYQVDETSQQLKASNRSYSAWFYLAYLHALTSHGLPELFTGMSGTERSFQILQSAFVWSPAPYDVEASTMLQSIRKLAPIRRIRQNMQSVGWPDFIDSHAAQDGFLYIANRLIAESVRLEDLYSKNNATSPVSPSTDKGEANNGNKEIEIELNVNVREYFRCLPYFPNLQLSETFIEHQAAISTHYIHNENDQNLSKVRTISNLYHQQKFVSPKSFSLRDYLTKDDSDLKGSLDMDDNDHILDLFSAKNVRNVWLSLYNVARSGQFSCEKFALGLGLLAYESTGKDDLDALLLLQTVAANPTIFNGLDPPTDVNVFYLNDRPFNYRSIEKILEEHETDSDRRYNEMKEIQHVLSVRDYIHKIVTKVRSMWPCDRVDPSIYDHIHPDIDLREAVKRINKKLKDWRNIDRLMDFLGHVDIQIRRLSTKLPVDVLPPWCPEKLPFKSFTKFYVDFDAKIMANLSQFDTEVSESKQISTEPAKAAGKDWWCIYNSIASPNDVKHLVDSTMYPRLVLSLVLPKLLSATQNPDLRSIITAVGMQIVHEQRARRISAYVNKPEMNVALEQEVNTVPHTNWSPYEHPEWLLFEIEQNLTIRPIQIEVAERMIDPPDVGTKHSVMQLNMGEGKTSVICPLLAANLANGKQLCQVTVLKSLFATNLKELRQCLGGMLNRRVYTFPCRRDMPIDRYAETILDIYVECRRLKGVVLTLPEFRLSFQLKIYEAPSKNEMECAKMLLQTHKWLNQNVRNILDESDAILQPKYQLIYTLGQQISLDGGAQRWTVIQALLKRLPIHLYELWEQFRDEKMEFDSDYAKHGQVAGHPTMAFRSDVFTPCRIFDSHVYNRLKLKLIDDIVDGHLSFSLGLVHQTKQTLRLLLDEGDVSANYYNELMKDLSSTQQITILILSGFLRFNVLQLVLGKRWRVNYGVNENGPRQMAIPFKAKDVAAEMTEFGHPDVAICFTQLSYYYSGLNETQLREVFRILESQQNSAEIYSGWINSVPNALVHDSIQSYTSVNLSDPKQRNELVFPLFKHNMYVIDYWLSNLVFPREAKTFEHKLMCTAWDLVGDNITHTVSGFSGTNDTKNILPLPVKQNDLRKLEQTNDNVRGILLREENSGYHRLPANVRGPQILITLNKLKIFVLLDAGACMLELNNEQVASQWLTLVDPNYFDATVYFNRNDVLMTVDRNGIRTEFDYSVYRNKLDRCLVYLDDAHTRGTDLKFPLGWKACVTLSGDITRDKTVQACMRMRLLGRGHSIVFLASYEAHIRILETCNLKNSARPTSRDVLEFISGNSKRYEEENTVHWSAAAFNYTKKLVAHKVHENNSDEVDAMAELHLKCKDNEYVTLKDMYGMKESALLTQISKNQFDKMMQAHQNEPEIMEMIRSIYDGVRKKLSLQAPRLQRYTQCFDEEQEKELEHELEEQRQIERPPPATAAIPVFDDLLENLIRSGVTSQSFRKMRLQKNILSFHESLLNKPMYSAHRLAATPWSENLYVTRDFVSVVESGNSEDYLRPVWWVAHIIHCEGDDIFLLLSSYEANRLVPLFRKSERAALMSYRPRLSQMHSNLLNQDILEVTGINTHSGDRIGVDEEVQIGMYSGSMYFRNEAEQDAYCGFMGLIPTPRTVELELAFEEGIISPNSYVLPEHRRHSAVISRFVKKCKFQGNPVELAIKIIEAHHVFVRKESHVSAVLEKATKKKIN